MIDQFSILDVWKSQQSYRDAIETRRSYYKGEQTIFGYVRRNTSGQTILESNLLRKDGRYKTNGHTNWIKYIVDFHTGFNLSNKINYTTYDGTSLFNFNNYYEANNLPALDIENFSNALLFGCGVELITYDGEQLKFRAYDPADWVFVNDERGEMIAAIYKATIQPFTYFAGALTKEKQDIFYIYTPESTTICAGAKELIPISTVPNPLGYIPIIRYQVGKSGESFITHALLDQSDLYDVVANSLTDDIKYSVDSFLQLKGIDINELLKADSDGITILERIKELGLFPTPKDAEILPIEKSVDVEKFKYDLRVRRMALHLMGCVPDLTDTVNANGASTSISGIALKILFNAAIQKSAEFRRYFTVGLRQRLDIINRYAGLVGNIPTAQNVDIKMIPNLPVNDIEWLQYAANLKGLVPSKEIFRLLPFIQSPDLVYSEYQAEQKQIQTEIATNPVA